MTTGVTINFIHTTNAYFIVFHRSEADLMTLANIPTKVTVYLKFFTLECLIDTPSLPHLPPQLINIFIPTPCLFQPLSYFPFKKSNNTTLYIHSTSNHPPSLIKQLSSITNKPILKLSCDETEFNKAKVNKSSQNTRRNRNGKVIRFKPPSSLNIKTIIGEKFFKLIRKHCPRNMVLERYSI